LEELVHRAQQGDDGAFERLYREHVGRVYALCLRLTTDARAAEELTQDVFIRVWTRLGSFRGDAAFTTWLHRLTVNVVLHQKRSALRRELRVVTEDPEVLEEMSPAAPAERAMDIDDAIAGLPPGARTVFVLHDIEGYRHEEIAELLGIAAGTSKAHLFRARRQLRRVLEP